MTTTNSDLWREFNWKNIIRFFITPRIKQFQTGNQIVGECWRKFGNVMADHFHIFWDCNSIRTYWQVLNGEDKCNNGIEPECNFKQCTWEVLLQKITKKDIYIPL